MKKYLKDLTPDEVIRRLKDGEVVRYNGVDAQTKYIDGVLCNVYTDKLFSINSTISVYRHCTAYFEIPDEIVFDIGKKYKTRDGQQVYLNIHYLDTEEWGGYFFNDKDLYLWDRNGKFLGDENNNCWDKDGNFCDNTEKLDIIAEWSDDDVEEN